MLKTMNGYEGLGIEPASSGLFGKSAGDDDSTLKLCNDGSSVADARVLIVAHLML